MTLRTRKILFYFLIILFLIISVAAIFYSNGWRFDLETLTINKLGALYFEIIPADTTITIDKTNFEFNPGIFRSGTLIANLFAKTYNVKVTKNGYQPWMKQLVVQPSLVTQAPLALLLPEKFNLGASIGDNIQNFWIGAKYPITLRDNALKLNSQTIIGNRIETWSKDGSQIITELNNSYFLVNLDTPANAVNLNLMLKNLQGQKDASSIWIAGFSPLNKNQIILATQKALYLLDIRTLIAETIHKEPVEALTSQNNEIFFSSAGKIFIYNLVLKIKTPLMDFAFESIKDILLSQSNDYMAILEKNGTLYIADRKSPAPKQIAQRISIAVFSPDGKKIAFLSDKKELLVHTLIAKSQNSEKLARFNLGTIGTEIAWHKNSEYLFVEYPSGVYLLETSGLPPINLQTIDMETNKYRYDPNNNILYILKNASLYKIKMEF